MRTSRPAAFHHGDRVVATIPSMHGWSGTVLRRAGTFKTHPMMLVRWDAWRSAPASRPFDGAMSQALLATAPSTVWLPRESD